MVNKELGERFWETFLEDLIKSDAEKSVQVFKLFFQENPFVIKDFPAEFQENKNIIKAFLETILQKLFHT